QRNSDIVGNGLDEFQVLTRQVIAILSSTQCDVSNDSVLYTARNKVVQIAQVCFEKNIAAVCRWFQETEVCVLANREAGCSRRHKARGIEGMFHENRSAADEQGAPETVDNAIQHLFKMHFRSKRPAKID